MVQAAVVLDIRPWYHRPGGTSMMACGNIIKEDQDFGTVESLKSPLLPLPISCCMPFICVRRCEKNLKGEWSVYRQNKWLFNKSTAVFYGLYSYRPYNDVKKCSKLKWNHEPQASGFTAKFWTFYGVILWSIRV